MKEEPFSGHTWLHAVRAGWSTGLADYCGRFWYEEEFRREEGSRLLSRAGCGEIQSHDGDSAKLLRARCAITY